MARQRYQTRGRILIEEYLMEHRARVVTAEELHRYLEQEGAGVNITTIYRQLERLASQSQVRIFPAEKGKKSGYQYSVEEVQCHDHLHLQCVDCGKIIHLNCHFMDEIARHISGDHNFDLRCENSVLFGKCSECQKEDTKPTSPVDKGCQSC